MFGSSSSTVPWASGKHYIASFLTSDICNTIVSARLYGPSCIATCISAGILYRTLSCSRPYSDLVAFHIISIWARIVFMRWNVLSPERTVLCFLVAGDTNVASCLLFCRGYSRTSFTTGFLKTLQKWQIPKSLCILSLTHWNTYLSKASGVLTYLVLMLMGTRWWGSMMSLLYSHVLLNNGDTFWQMCF